MADLPAWIEKLVSLVAKSMVSHGMAMNLGLRYGNEDNDWEITVYPLPIELVGGAHDGEVVAPGFSLDLEILRAAFSKIEDMSWQAHPLGEKDEGPLISIEGTYQGHSVWLRVLAQSPEDEEPGSTFDTNKGSE